MAQIRQINPRNGITYVYEATPFWDKERKQSRYLDRRMIGHIDPESGELVANRPMKPKLSAPEASRLFAGATHLLGEIADQIGLTADLSETLGEKGKAVEAFAQFLVAEDPAPASRFGLWARTHAQPLGDQVLSSQRWSEVFAGIRQEDVEAFFRARVKRASGQYWFFDTTSISSYSKLLEKVRWGHNKDGVALPQINLAMVKDGTTGLPLAYKDLPGNITDVTLVKQLLADFARYGAGRMKLCMDRGFYSKANIDDLMAAHMKFLIGTRIGLGYVKQALAEHSHFLRSWQNLDVAKHLYGMRLDQPWQSDLEATTKRSYLYLFFDPRRATQEEETFGDLIAQLYHELVSGATTAGHQSLYDKYFHKTKTGWTGNDQAIEAERDKHGYFALLSNDASLDCWAALDVYRSKDQIEKAFHDVKDRLAMRTTSVHNQETLTGKLFTVYTALIITSELCRRMTTCGLDKQYTITELLDQLETVEQYLHQHRKPVILHVTKKQTEIYTALRVNPPTS